MKITLKLPGPVVILVSLLIISSCAKAKHDPVIAKAAYHFDLTAISDGEREEQGVLIPT